MFAPFTEKSWDSASEDQAAAAQAQAQRMGLAANLVRGESRLCGDPRKLFHCRPRASNCSGKPGLCARSSEARQAAFGAPASRDQRGETKMPKRGVSLIGALREVADYVAHRKGHKTERTTNRAGPEF